MRIENDNIIISRSAVSFALCYELQQLSFWAAQNPERLEYHQNVIEGMLDILDLPPVDYNIIMRSVRRVPTKESISAAYQTVVGLFGKSDMSLKEVLGSGS